ncbi:MAG: major capsid protein [Smithella sp.]|jgi:hypothetical protein
MSTTALIGKNTIADIMNQYSSEDGSAMYIKAANVLALKCPLYRMLPMQATNQLMSEIYSKVLSMGSPSLRRFNEYITPTANHTAPGTEPTFGFVDWSEVDADLCDIQNDPTQWRMDQDLVKMESMTQAAEDQLLNGNISTYPAGINGLFTRYNSSTRRPNGVSTTRYNVQLAGGGGSDVTSIIAMELGPTKLYGIFPKNTKAGISIENKGKVTAESGTGRMDVYRTKLSFYGGLVVKDDRCVQMVRNIEVSGTSNTFDPDQLSSALRRLPGGGQDPNTIILCSPTIMDQMDSLARDKFNVTYTPDEVWGGQITRFMRVPVYMAEMISEAQTAIS